MEKDSIANFYVSTNEETNSTRGAAAWQERTAEVAAGNFVSRSKETISGRYTSLCVTGTNAEKVEVLDCVVEDVPLTFSFAGSQQAEEEARGILRSLR